ncbi:MAG: MFS transporter [Oceanipulchritudo sp.]
MSENSTNPANSAIIPGNSGRPAHRITLQEKLAFASGSVLGAGAPSVLLLLLFPVYNIILGVSPALLGWVQAIMRMWDAFTDPFFGYLSDNTKSRWGRRKPYIAVGGVIASLIFPFIWTPSPGWSETTLFLYLLVTVLCFLSAYSAFQIPFESLGVELTTDYNEKTRLYAFRAYLPPVIGLGCQWILPLVKSDFFADPMQGLALISISLGVLMLGTLMVPLYKLKERAPVEMGEGDRIPLGRSLRLVLTNRPFLHIAAMTVFCNFAASIFQQAGLYAQVYVLYDGDLGRGATLNAYVALVYFFVNYFCIHLGSKLAQRYNKHQVVIGAACLTFIAGLLKIVLYNPEMPYLVLLLPFFTAPAGAVGSFMINSLMADVAHYGEWKNGVRQEALFTAAASWLYKFSISIASIFSGYYLVWIGFDVALEGNQTDFTKSWLIIGMVLASCIPAVITILAMWFYPLTQKRMDGYSRDLEERRRLRLGGDGA